MNKTLLDEIKKLLLTPTIRKRVDIPREKYDAVNFGIITQGTATPTSTPVHVGYIYIDTAHAKVYLATGTTNASSWTVVN